MAAPAGSGAVEAYKNTKVRGATPATPVASWAPSASAAVSAKAAELHRAAGQAARASVSAQDPFRATGFAAAPKELPKGGRKKSRRRRGGALTKPLPELLMDLQRDPSKATLENVISDFKASGIRLLEERGQRLEEQLRAGASPEYLIELAARSIEGILNQGGDNEIPFRRRGGRRSKTTRRRR